MIKIRIGMRTMIQMVMIDEDDDVQDDQDDDVQDDQDADNDEYDDGDVVNKDYADGEIRNNMTEYLKIMLISMLILIKMNMLILKHVINQKFLTESEVLRVDANMLHCNTRQ